MLSLVGPIEQNRFERLIGPAGDSRLLLFNCTDLENGGQVVLAEDVTQVRAMEQTVEREERMGAVGRLAAGLAHEIRNPLASLSGSVQLMREDSPGPLFDIVIREVGRINELVEEFLEIARPVKLDISLCDPAEIIGDVAEAFRHDPRYQGRRVVRTHAGHVPAVRLDSRRFRQVIWNLVLNAAQSTGEYGEIEMSADISDGGLLVLVSDNGVGIAPNKLARVFDPFYTTRSGGTGLGLANVHRIVDGHGGKIEVSSVPGEGTKFTLWFPVDGPDVEGSE